MPACLMAAHHSAAITQRAFGCRLQADSDDDKYQPILHVSYHALRISLVHYDVIHETSESRCAAAMLRLLV